MTEFKAGDKVLVAENARQNSHPERLAGKPIRGQVVYVSNPKVDWQGSITVDFEGQEEGWFVNPNDLTLVENTPDMVNRPSHYTSDPSGVECITITRHRNFNIGNAIKYLWRAGLKGDAGKDIEDLRKAVFYINDEIARLENERI